MASDSNRAAPAGMAGRSRTLDVTALLADAPLTPLPIIVLILAVLVIMLDGYDLICLSFVAPQLAGVLGIPVAKFGPIFAAGYVGIMVGGFLIGPLGDRFGRKIILIGSVALFGLFSLLPVFDLSYDRLLVYRFITGLGLGGAMPSAAALTSEYTPRRLRGFFVNLMFAGVSVGGVVGGSLAARLVPAYGWQAVFWMGGLGPLALALILVLLMPESIAFLAVNNRRPHYVASTLRRFGIACSAADTFVARESGRQPGFAVAKLFREGRTVGTLLIWLTSFSVLLTFALLSSWLPTFLTMHKMDTHTSILGPVAMNLGGIVGTVLLGILFTRLGASPLIAGAIALTGAALIVFARAMGVETQALAAVFVVGMFLLGSINSTNTLMSTFYPTPIRATGVGWALGVGRIGATVGPAAGGLLLGHAVSPETICQLLAVVAAVGMGAVGLVGVFYPAQRRPERPAAPAPLPTSQPA